MTVDELEVLITANTNDLRKEMSSANKGIEGLKKSAKSSADGALKAFKMLKTGIVALGIGKVIKDSITMGMDAIESDSLFETVMGDNAAAVKSWSNEVSNTLGLNAVAMQKNIGVIYNMTSSMGVAGDNALKMSKGISVLAEDMASFYNLESEEAFNKLKAGITGETEPLKSLGILVDENTVKQVAYSEGIAENGAQLTQQQKVLARYVAILKQTGNAQGDLARTITSPSNQLRQLKSQITQLGLSLSNFFIPIVSAVLPYLNAFAKMATDALNSLKPLADKLAEFLGVSNTSASEEAEEVSQSVAGVGDGMDEATKKAKKLKAQLAGFDEMNVLQDNTSDSADETADASGGSLGFDLSEYDAKLELVNSSTEKLIEKIKKAFGGIGSVVKDIWNSSPVQAFVGAVQTYGSTLWTYWSTMGLNLYNNITTTWGNISTNVGTTISNIATLWTQMWTDIQLGLETWGQPIIDGVSGLFNSIWADAIDPYIQLVSSGWAGLTTTLVELWEEHGQPLVDNIGEFVNNVVALFQKLWDNILAPIILPFLQELKRCWEEYINPLIKKIGDFILTFVNGALEIYNKFVLPVIMWITDKLKPVFEFIGNIVSTVFGYLVGVISSAIGGIIGFFTGLIDFVVGIFTGNWSKAWEGIKTMFTSVWDAIKGVAVAAWDYIKGVFSAVGEFFTGIWESIKEIFASVGTWFKDIFTGAWEGIKTAFSAVGSFFTGIWESIKEIFANVGSAIADAVGGTVKKAINTVLSVAIGIINGFIGAINLAISAINLIPGVNITKLKEMEVPELARGGIVDHPTYAMIGEAGKEAVMPLERNTGWIDQLADKIAEKIGGGGGEINLTVKLGEENIFNRFIEYGRSKAFETNGEVVFA